MASLHNNEAVGQTSYPSSALSTPSCQESLILMSRSSELDKVTDIFLMSHGIKFYKTNVTGEKWPTLGII